MDVVLIELVLWAGLIFFLWVLKDTLSNMESELDHGTAQKAGAGRVLSLARAERLSEPIGSYDGVTIYRYAVIEGKTYEFDCVSVAGMDVQLPPHQRCLAPGLIYSERPALAAASVSHDN
jgi:hypothetical protein